MDLVTLAVYGVGWWLWQQRDAPPKPLGQGSPTTVAPTDTGQGLVEVPAFPNQTYTPAPRPALPIAPPQSRGFVLSDQMLAKLSQKAISEVIRWFNSPVQTQVNISPESTEAWNAYKAGERADYTSWTKEQQPAIEPEDLVPESNAQALDVTEAASSSGLADSAGAQLVTNTVETLATGDIVLTLADTLTAIAIVGVLVDVGFTIASDQPTALKAINVAIDAAIIVCLFIPVYGWVIAIALGIVKVIVNLFFGHQAQRQAQRNAQEIARAMESAQGLARMVGEALSPRELVDAIWRYTTLYCGGPVHSAGGDAIIVRLDTGSQGSIMIAPNPCYANQGGAYREWTNAVAMTRDDQALALVSYADSDLHVAVQAGIKPELLAGPDWALDEGITKKCVAWRELMVHGLTLDQLDLLAVEHRKEPRMEAIATFFGAASWYDLVGWHLQDLWTRYLIHSREGSLSDFAHRFGFPTWVALRDAVIDQYSAVMDRAVTRAGGNIFTNAIKADTPHDALTQRLHQLDLYVQDLIEQCIQAINDAYRRTLPIDQLAAEGYYRLGDTLYTDQYAYQQAIAAISQGGGSNGGG